LTDELKLYADLIYSAIIIPVLTNITA